LVVVLLHAAPAAAQVELTARPDLAAGYDSNIYYGAGALPDDNTVEGAPLLSVAPRLSLGYRPGGGHMLMLQYDGDLRQVLSDDLDNETLFQHGASLAYQTPALWGLSAQAWGGFKQLYVRQLEGAGWLGGAGGVILSRLFGGFLLLSLGYKADYTAYYDEDSSSAQSELSHAVSASGTWRPVQGLLFTLGYTFASVDADPDSLSALEHMAGLDLSWEVPWIPVAVRGGYLFMAYMMESATSGLVPIHPPPGSGPGPGPGPGSGPGPGPGPATGEQINEDRTDLIHQGYAEVSWRALPWLQVFGRWDSVWGQSSLTRVEDYSRHQGMGGLRFTWGFGGAAAQAAAGGTGPAVPPAPDLGLTVVYRDPRAREVALVGSFNGWDPAKNPLRRQGKEWRLTLALPEGMHQYQVWVDGEMRPPQQCGRWLDDGFGGKNCAVLIAARATGGEG